MPRACPDPTDATPAGSLSAASVLAYYAGIPLRWGHQFFHNTHGILRVLDITRWRPLPAGLLAPDHPWCTGLAPDTGEPVWHGNILYRSPRKRDHLTADRHVVTEVGRFLARMCALSAATPVIPWGPQRPMPHGINYIHGTAHYNSGWLVFDGFADAIRHVSDPRFTAEIRRFVRDEKRELLLVFRDRDYDPRDYAYFTCVMRTMFGWFCNANGPNKRVLWGNPSPYPAANLITGKWIRDVYALKSPGGAAKVVRPRIEGNKYFTESPYRGWRDAPLWPERLLARYTDWRVGSRGSKGGLFFVDRERLLEGQLARLAERGLKDEPVARL